MNTIVTTTQTAAARTNQFALTRRITAALCILASAAAPVSAAPGDLDPTFALKGKLVSGFGGGDDRANAVEVQADGKIVAAGYAQHGDGNQLVVVRYNVDGSRDTSFASFGSVETSFGVDSTSEAYALAIQGDGKIVAGGYVRREGQFNFVLVRYNPDGSPDNSFGAAGLVETEFGGPAFVHALGIQVDGKILAVGSTSVGFHDEFAIARYKSDGSPDLSFGVGGKVIATGTNTGLALIFVNDGKFIVAGAGPIPNNSNGVLLARYDNEGKLDTSFGTNGLASLTASTDEQLAVAIQTSFTVGDKILVATGRSLVRFLINGAPDTGFGTGGVVTAGHRNCGLAFQTLTGVPTRILVAGTATNPANGAQAFTLSRYLLSGAPDTAFGNGGIIYTAMGGFVDYSQAMRARSGKIIVAGFSGSDAGFSQANFAVARYTLSDGSLDTSFDGDGKRLDDVGNASTDASGVAVQADGRILVTGTATLDNSRVFGLLRRNSDGTPDLAFGGIGQVVTKIGQTDDAYAVAVQPDGKIVVAGDSDGKFALARYNPTGSLDSTFSGGTVITPVGAYSHAAAVAIQPDGKIVAAGECHLSATGDSDFALVRYLDNGMPDLMFGNGGKVTTNIAGDDTAAAVAIQPDGKIVVAGTFVTGSSSQIVLLRYDSKGALDRGFGSDGIVVTTFPGDIAAAGYGLALQADGRIVVVGGTARPNHTVEIAVVRYLTSGALDPSFNGNGRVSTPVGIISAIANAVSILPDGRIMVAGSSFSGGNNVFTAVRYKTSGLLDTSFGSGGKATVNVGEGDDYAYGLALDSSGRAILAGTSENLLALVRLEGGGAEPPPTPTPTPTPATTLANISTRLRVGSGENVLIAGFIVTGTQPKKVIIRGIGPSLPFADKLTNPALELYGPNGLIEANDNWVDSPNKQAIIDSTIPPSNNSESAIVATLPANGAGYTAIVRGVNDGTGIGVVEVYDLDRTVDSKLANISTRGFVSTGDNVLIAGTIVLGSQSQKVIVRAIGPSLPIPGKLNNPTLEMRDGNGGLIEANDNWVDSPNKQAIIDSTIPPTNDLESAIVQTLPANGASYTAIVRGVNDAPGIAVVEVYALQ